MDHIPDFILNTGPWPDIFLFGYALMQVALKLKLAKTRRSAANLAVALLESNAPLQIKVDETGYAVISALKPGLTRRSKFLCDTFSDGLARAHQDERSRDWLTQSLMSIELLVIDQVCRDFFGHLTVDKLLRKALRGDVALPIVRIETSQKAQRGVHLVDLAAYIDKRRAAAVKECRQLTGQM